MGLHVGEVRYPETVRRGGHELAIHEVTRSVLGVVGSGRHLEVASAANSREPLNSHEPAHRAVGDLDALAVQLLPDLLVAVNAVESVVVDPLDLTLEHLIST